MAQAFTGLTISETPTAGSTIFSYSSKAPSGDAPIAVLLHGYPQWQVALLIGVIMYFDIAIVPTCKCHQAQQSVMLHCSHAPLVRWRYVRPEAK